MVTSLKFSSASLYSSSDVSAPSCTLGMSQLTCTLRSSSQCVLRSSEAASVLESAASHVRSEVTADYSTATFLGAVTGFTRLFDWGKNQQVHYPDSCFRENVVFIFFNDNVKNTTLLYVWQIQTVWSRPNSAVLAEMRVR